MQIPTAIAFSSKKNADHTLNCKMEMLSCAQLKGANPISSLGCGSLNQHLSTQLNWLIINSHKVPIMNTFNISYSLRPYNSHTIFFCISILCTSIGVTTSPVFRFLTSTPLCRYMFPFPVLFSGSLHLHFLSSSLWWPNHCFFRYSFLGHALYMAASS